MTSSEVVFYELLRVLLESFSKQEYTLFFEKHRGEQTNCSVLSVGEAMVGVSNFSSLHALQYFSDITQ